MTVVRHTSIPFGWKVIPQTAEAASDTLRVNLERLNIHFAKTDLYGNERGIGGGQVEIPASESPCVSPVWRTHAH